MKTAGEKFQDLVGIMARLRAPDGCPWDREQTFDTIKPYTLEETYEVLDAIDRRDWNGLAEELGDLLCDLVNLARFVKVEPEQALRKTNAKFRKRFGFIERKLAERGKKLADSNIEEMEALWQEAKK